MVSIALATRNQRSAGGFKKDSVFAILVVGLILLSTFLSLSLAKKYPGPSGTDPFDDNDAQGDDAPTIDKLTSIIAQLKKELQDTKDEEAKQGDETKEQHEDSKTQHVATNSTYNPSSIETYLMDNLVNLGFDIEAKNVSGCNIWKDKKIDIHEDLFVYATALDKYNKAITKFEEVPDVMDSIQASQNGSNEICKSLRVHPDGIQAFFPEELLSHGTSGFMEPLTPPMRHHSYCWKGRSLFKQDFILHDFEAMCKKLKPTSKRVFIDIGASMNREKNPLVTFLAEFKKFGFHFDHIYAFEVAAFDAKDVYKNILPDEYMANYHWINTGVEAGKEDKMNPLHSILRKFKEDDFIIIKLDIDTPAIELPLATQLLEDESLHPLVDLFYFEHHVFMAEMAKWWTRSMAGSIKDTMDLFHGLRQKGVSAHFWI